jgi:hypothetical protein
MPGTDYRNGMPIGDFQYQSRTAEFSGGVSGGGNVHSVQQFTPQSYQPSSVLNPTSGSSNGMSDQTYSANRILNLYRSY